MKKISGIRLATTTFEEDWARLFPQPVKIQKVKRKKAALTKPKEHNYYYSMPVQSIPIDTSPELVEAIEAVELREEWAINDWKDIYDVNYGLMH